MRAHERCILALCADHVSVQTRGFVRALRKLTDSDLSWWRWRPDAYEATRGYVVAYEVEDTHRLDHVKKAAYTRLWRQLDADDIELRLVVMDIRGGRWEPDLGAAYFEVTAAEDS